MTTSHSETDLQNEQDKYAHANPHTLKQTHSDTHFIKIKVFYFLSRKQQQQQKKNSQ